MGKQRGLMDKTFRSQQQGRGDGGALSGEQGQLRQQLGKVLNGLRGRGPLPKEFGEADRGMGESQKELGGNDLADSNESQKEVLNALRKGAGALADQLNKEMAAQQGGSAGEEDSQDPLGREQGNGRKLRKSREASVTNGTTARPFHSRRASPACCRARPAERRTRLHRPAAEGILSWTESRMADSYRWPAPWQLASRARRDSAKVFRNSKPLLVFSYALLVICSAAGEALVGQPYAGAGQSLVQLAGLIVLAPVLFVTTRRVLADAGEHQGARGEWLNGATKLTALLFVPWLAGTALAIWARAGAPQALIGIAWIAFAVVIARTSLSISGIAVSDTDAVRQSIVRSWAATRGHAAKLILALVLAFVPVFVFVFVPYMLIAMILSKTVTWFMPDAMPWISPLLSALAELVAGVLFAAVAAHAFLAAIRG